MTTSWSKDSTSLTKDVGFILTKDVGFIQLHDNVFLSYLWYYSAIITHQEDLPLSNQREKIKIPSKICMYFRQIIIKIKYKKV